MGDICFTRCDFSLAGNFFANVRFHSEQGRAHNHQIYKMDSFTQSAVLS